MPEPVIDRDDVDAIFAVLLDIKVLLVQIVSLLGGGDEPEEEQES